MADTNEELKKFLTDVQRYLYEEQKLFGNYIFSDSTVSPPKKTQPSQPQPQAVEYDLFGNPMTSATLAKHGKVSEPPAPNYPNEPWVKATTLDEFNSMICTCTKCPLGHTRTNFVFGVGNPHAEIVLIGEAPGAEEDAQGEPFVGRAGQLLNKILEAINFKREEVYICNILKCRPPNNRDPQPEEIDACEPHLWKQIELIQPKLILCLGRISAQVLLKTNASLTELRAKVHNYRGIPMMVTYHPAALLRNPHWKRPTWEDVQRFRKMYDELKAK
jgi:DNA polymerase